MNKAISGSFQRDAEELTIAGPAAAPFETPSAAAPLGKENLSCYPALPHAEERSKSLPQA
jgi:hypothetical protein